MFWTILMVAVFVWMLISWRRRRHGLLLPDLRNRHIFITGCDTGFGNALARRLDSIGVPVFASCFTEKGEKELIKACSSRVTTLQLDVTDLASINNAVGIIKRTLGQERGLWGLVNNAGVIHTICPAEGLPSSEMELVIKVNVVGLYNVTLACLPLIRKAQGRIVNLSSSASYVETPGLAAYCMSKFAVAGFTGCLRRELAVLGVSVHSIKPRGFNTNLFGPEHHRKREQIFNNMDPELKTMYPRKRIDAINRYFASSPTDVSPVIDAEVHALLSAHPQYHYMVGKGSNKVWLISQLPIWITDNIYNWK